MYACPGWHPHSLTRGLRLLRLALGLLVLLGPLLALAAEPPIEPAEGGAANAQYTLYLELVVNELPSDRVVQVSFRDGHYFVAADDLRAVGVRLPEGATGEQSLDAISGLQHDYDQELQRLKLTLPSDWLPNQQVGQTALYANLPAQSSFGLLFNYDAYYNDTEDGAHYASAWLEQRAFGGAGVVSNTGVYRHSFNDLASDQDGYMRYDTYWRYNNQETMTRYLAGDLVTGALTWNSAVRLGGVQVASRMGAGGATPVPQEALATAEAR